MSLGNRGEFANGTTQRERPIFHCVGLRSSSRSFDRVKISRNIIKSRKDNLAAFPEEYTAAGLVAANVCLLFTYAARLNKSLSERGREK